jgi:hypothetical protein
MGTLPPFDFIDRGQVLIPRERPWRIRPVRASVVEKLRTARVS